MKKLFLRKSPGFSLQKRLLPFVTFWLTLVCVSMSAQTGSTKIYSASYLHFFNPSLLVNDGVSFQTYLAQDRKLIAESKAITEALVKKVKEEKPEIFLISLNVAKLSQAHVAGYTVGDFHQHTTFTDGSYTLDFMMSKNNQFGLDWWANSEHGGGFATNGFVSEAWNDSGNGWKEMTLTVDVSNVKYFRLRGSNSGLNVANETDGSGNPLSDYLMGTNDATKAFADLWFYSNPTFVASDSLLNKAKSIDSTQYTVPSFTLLKRAIKTAVNGNASSYANLQKALNDLEPKATHIA